MGQKLEGKTMKEDFEVNAETGKTIIPLEKIRRQDLDEE